VLSQAGGSVFSEGESPEQLAEAMKRLCALSDEELESLGKKNRAYFDAHFSLDTIADEVIKELKRFQ
jgi:glycosyltransferase involved in cell wall biosynthesis